MWLWSAGIAVGISNEAIWELSVPEIVAVLDRKAEEARQAILRAGLVAATIVNVNRKKGAALVQPSDFLREPRRAEDYMDLAEAKAALGAFAKSHNQAMAESAE